MMTQHAVWPFRSIRISSARDKRCSRHAVKSAITADDALAPCEDLEEAALEGWKGGEGA